MKKHYPVIIEQDKDGIFIVECPVLKSCRSYGKTINEAIDNIREAIEVCLLDEPPSADDKTTFIGIRDLEMDVASFFETIKFRITRVFSVTFNHTQTPENRYNEAFGFFRWSMPYI